MFSYHYLKVWLAISLIVLPLVSSATPSIGHGSPWGKIKWLPVAEFSDALQDSQEPAAFNKDKRTFKFIGRVGNDEESFIGDYNPDTKLLTYNKKGAMAISQEEAKQKKYAMFILTYPTGTVTWAPGGCSRLDTRKKRKLPRNLIVGGENGKKEKMFICRAMESVNVAVGYFLLSNKGVCTVAFGGKVQEFERFELLTINWFGIVSGAGVS